MSGPDGAAPAGARRTALREREDGVLARLQVLAAGLDDGPDPAFRAGTRDRLVAMAAVRTPVPAPRSRLRRLLAARASDRRTPAWRARLTAGLVGAALTVTAAGGVVALAGDARPGDVLYGVKRGTEQTRLALTGSDRGLTLLQFAATRLDELGALAGAAPADVVIGVLDTMDEQTTEGAALLAAQAVRDADAAPVDELAVWTAEQSVGLVALRSDVPAGAGAAAEDSLTLLADLARRAAGLRSALACPTGPAVDAPDALGPVPVACAAEVPAAAAPEAPAPPTADPAPVTGPAADAPDPTSSTPQAPAPSPSRPLPLPPVGGPPAGGLPTVPAPSRPAPPPLVDTPLPVCIPLLIC
ncbi:DUF5667 domain-containing protein [Geodermatophilus sp. CPCC 205761]|uniref:DUF5667 domain-containing protein n=1 Tax=Geodermatophilus sp. CPCC 205761 TaxID=2936597 RepID=UPI003EEE1865